MAAKYFQKFLASFHKTMSRPERQEKEGGSKAASTSQVLPSMKLE